jgi:hypothetical protein
LLSLGLKKVINPKVAYTTVANKVTTDPAATPKMQFHGYWSAKKTMEKSSI